MAEWAVVIVGSKHRPRRAGTVLEVGPATDAAVATGLSTRNAEMLHHGVSLQPLLQAGGYVDPNTGGVRRIPFEIMVKGDKEPVYEENLEDNGRFNEQPVLPFNAFGTMALARSEFESNSGSSQIFWLLKVGLLRTALTTIHQCMTRVTPCRSQSSRQQAATFWTAGMAPSCQLLGVVCPNVCSVRFKCCTGMLCLATLWTVSHCSR